MSNNIASPPQYLPETTKPLRILLVEDDYYFRTTLSRVLEKEKFEVTVSENGIQAKQVMSLQEFDLVISDIKMPGFTGLELLQWIQGQSQTPVILMTGFTEIEQTIEATQIGAVGFLAKPFKREDLIQIIEANRPTVSSAPPPQEKETYCKVSIDDFITGSEIRYSIYIQLKPEKFVKVAHNGEDISVDRISAYKKKGVNNLYLRTQDYRDYIDFNIRISKALEGSKAIDHKRKIDFVRNATTTVLEKLFTSDTDEETFYQAKTLVESAVVLMGDNPDVTSVLESLCKHGDFLYAHSVGVSLYSAMIGKKLGWKSPTSVFRLTAAGLLHDIGKKEIPMAVLEKSRKLLNSDEIALIESHPKRGFEIMASVASIPGDIPQIILQHHEDCQGLGYPAHLKKDRIHPMARVIAVADEFCKYVIKNPTCEGVAPKEALKRMIAYSADRLDESALVSLLQIFSYAAPGECVEIVKKAKYKS